MHHAIIGKPPKGLITDHKDGNGLNNQRNNLRFVTRRQNAQNIHNMNPTSRFLGVVWAKANKKWVAQIWINGKNTHLGCFIDELEAAEAYKEALKGIGEVLIDNL